MSTRKTARVMFAAVGSEVVSIEAISAMLRKHGHQCALAFDRALFDDKQYFSVPFLARIFDDRATVVRDIVEARPDLLAFSVFADNFQWCLAIARAVKERIDVPVVMGGIHPTSVPEVCISQDPVDIVCLGEGEYPMLELADSIARGAIDYTILNLWFKKDGAVVRNQARPLIADLDELPLIDKELFEPFIPIRDYYLTVTNKGCLSTCSYCSQNFYARWEKDNLLGKFFRERSVESVVNELAHMKERYALRRIDIKNNVLSASRSWTFEFTRRYADRIGLPFRIMGHPKTITPETARALKGAGCWHVQLGVESLNPEVRREILNRYESNEDIAQALEAMEEAGLGYSVDIMVGLPGENDDDVVEALKLLAGRRCLVRASIFWLEYLPGVDITNLARARGIISNDDIAKIDLGLQANYLSTGSVTNKKKRECLLNYQLLFRALPILPGGLVRLLLRTRAYTLFRYLPQIPIIIAVDILVSIARRDHWAMYAMYSYLWELARRLRRRFHRRRSPWI